METKNNSLKQLLNHKYINIFKKDDLNNFIELKNSEQLSILWKNPETFVIEIYKFLKYQYNKKQQNSTRKCNSLKNKEIKFSGLKNIGNTCYFNSLIQIMYNIPEFYIIIMNSNKFNIDSKDESKLFNEINTLFTNLTLNYFKFFNPKKILKNLTDHDGNKFLWGEQRDFNEFLLLFFNNISFNLDKNNEIIFQKLFYGNKVTIDKYKNLNKEKFQSLLLNINNPNIYDLIEMNLITESKSYFKYEWLTDLPIILNWQLKRFIYDINIKEVIKNNDVYEITKTIDLSRFELKNRNKIYNKIKNKFKLEGYDINIKSNYELFKIYNGLKNSSNDINIRIENFKFLSSNIYNIFAIIIHKGKNLNFGHYYTFIKIQNCWYKFNDNIVTKVSEEYVFKVSNGEDYGESACNIFYRKEDQTNIFSNRNLYYDLIPNKIQTSLYDKYNRLSDIVGFIIKYKDILTNQIDYNSFRYNLELNEKNSTYYLYTIGINNFLFYCEKLNIKNDYYYNLNESLYSYNYYKNILNKYLIKDNKNEILELILNIEGIDNYKDIITDNVINNYKKFVEISIHLKCSYKFLGWKNINKYLNIIKYLLKKFEKYFLNVLILNSIIINLIGVILNFNKKISYLIEDEVLKFNYFINESLEIWESNEISDYYIIFISELIFNLKLKNYSILKEEYIEKSDFNIKNDYQLEVDIIINNLYKSIDNFDFNFEGKYNDLTLPEKLIDLFYEIPEIFYNFYLNIPYDKCNSISKNDLLKLYD